LKLEGKKTNFAMFTVADPDLKEIKTKGQKLKNSKEVKTKAKDRID
jgi:hypothetical protein